MTGRKTYDKVLTFDVWPYAGKRVIVLSTTLAADDARVTVARSVEQAVRELAESAADQVYIDGGTVIQLSLAATNASDTGMVHATYAVHRLK